MGIALPTAAVWPRQPVAPVVIATMGGDGMPAVSCSFSRMTVKTPALSLIKALGRMAEIDLFLLVLQCSGIAIALVGWRRERWLRRRRR